MVLPTASRIRRGVFLRCGTPNAASVPFGDGNISPFLWLLPAPFGCYFYIIASLMDSTQPLRNSLACLSILASAFITCGFRFSSSQKQTSRLGECSSAKTVCRSFESLPQIDSRPNASPVKPSGFADNNTQRIF